MEQGFGPKLSRIVAGVCFLLFLGLIDYLFGLRKLFAITLLFLLLVFLLSLALPKSLSLKRLVVRISELLDISHLWNWLEDRFETPKRS